MLVVFVLAIALRTVTALTVYELFGDSPVLDDLTYTSMAEDVAAGTTGHWDEYTRNLYDRTATLMVPLSLLYSIFGSEQIVGQIFVACIGAVTAVLACRLSMEILRPGQAVIVGLILAILPSQVLWSSLVLKDPMVWLLLISIALTLAIAARTVGKRLIVTGVVVTALLFLLAFLRQHTFVVASIAVALSAWFGIKEWRKTRALGAIAIGLLVPWLVGLGPLGIDFVREGASSVNQLRVLNAVGANSAFVDPPDTQDNAPPTSDELTTLREGVPEVAHEARVEEELVRAIVEALPGLLEPNEIADIARDFSVTEERVEHIAAALLDGIREERGGDPDTPVDEGGALEPSLAHLPRGLAVMLVEPIPGRTTASRSFQLAQMEMVLWYPLLLLAALGLPFLYRNRGAAAFPLVVGAGILFTYALSEGNIGTAYRHRGEFVWVVAIAAACGISSLYARYRRRRGADPISDHP
jgi:hypothetical protein